jgi:hypothetical protein
MNAGVSSARSSGSAASRVRGIADQVGELAWGDDFRRADMIIKAGCI